MGDDDRERNPAAVLLAIVCSLLIIGIVGMYIIGIITQAPAPTKHVNNTTLDTNITITAKNPDYFSGNTSQGYVYNGTNLHVYNNIEVNKTYPLHFYDYAIVNNSIYGDVDLANDTHNVTIWHVNKTALTNATLDTNITILAKTSDNFTGVTSQGYLYNSSNLHVYNMIDMNKTYPFHFYNYNVQNNTIIGDAVPAQETNKTVVVHDDYVYNGVVPFIYPWYMYSMYPYWYYYGGIYDTSSSSSIPASDYGYGTGSYSYSASKAVEVPADDQEQVAQQEEQLSTEEQTAMNEENVQLNDEGYTNSPDPSENTVSGSTQDESAQDSSDNNAADSTDSDSSVSDGGGGGGDGGGGE